MLSKNPHCLLWCVCNVVELIKAHSAALHWILYTFPLKVCTTLKTDNVLQIGVCVRVCAYMHVGGCVHACGCVCACLWVCVCMHVGVCVP